MQRRESSVGPARKRALATAAVSALALLACGKVRDSSNLHHTDDDGDHADAAVQPVDAGAPHTTPGTDAAANPCPGVRVVALHTLPQKDVKAQFVATSDGVLVVWPSSAQHPGLTVQRLDEDGAPTSDPMTFWDSETHAASLHLAVAGDYLAVVEQRTNDVGSPFDECVIGQVDWRTGSDVHGMTPFAGAPHPTTDIGEVLDCAVTSSGASTFTVAHTASTVQSDHGQDQAAVSVANIVAGQEPAPTDVVVAEHERGPVDLFAVGFDDAAYVGYTTLGAIEVVEVTQASPLSADVLGTRFTLPQSTTQLVRAQNGLVALIIEGVLFYNREGYTNLNTLPGPLVAPLGSAFVSIENVGPLLALTADAAFNSLSQRTPLASPSARALQVVFAPDGTRTFVAYEDDGETWVAKLECTN